MVYWIACAIGSVVNLKICGIFPPIYLNRHTLWKDSAYLPNQSVIRKDSAYLPSLGCYAEIFSLIIVSWLRTEVLHS
jgi:hypothetical protein